jgi:hypothetical protein
VQVQEHETRSEGTGEASGLRGGAIPEHGEVVGDKPDVAGGSGSGHRWTPSSTGHRMGRARGPSRCDAADEGCIAGDRANAHDERANRPAPKKDAPPSGRRVVTSASDGAQKSMSPDHTSA